MAYVVAEEVEVFGKGKGFEGSYHPAKVIQVFPNNKYCVKYKHLLQENSRTHLKETLPGKRLRPRPFHVTFDLVDEIDVGDIVDVNDKDSWWKGVIKRFDGEIYRVKFDLNEGVWEYQPNQVRIHMEWENGQWCFVKR